MASSIYAFDRVPTQTIKTTPNESDGITGQVVKVALPILGGVSIFALATGAAYASPAICGFFLTYAFSKGSGAAEKKVVDLTEKKKVEYTTKNADDLEALKEKNRELKIRLREIVEAHEDDLERVRTEERERIQRVGAWLAPAEPLSDESKGNAKKRKRHHTSTKAN